MVILLYLNLADWHAASLFHPPHVDYEIFHDLVCMNAVLCMICVMSSILLFFYIS